MYQSVPAPTALTWATPYPNTPKDDTGWSVLQKEMQRVPTHPKLLFCFISVKQECSLSRVKGK